MIRKLYIVYISLCITCLIGCRNEDRVIQERSDSVDSIKDTALSSPQPVTLQNSPYSVELDTKTQQLKIVRGTQDLKGIMAEDMILVLNKKYPGIQLKLEALNTDTLSVTIDDARALTQEMGSTGAEAYLAEVTFALTELVGIKAVKFDFEEGDHASPGVYTRENFEMFR